MLTIKELLFRTTDFFKDKGVENAKLDAELLLSHGLGLRSRLDLYLQYDRPLEEVQLAKIRPLVRRRAKGEPVQYIEGIANFMGVEFRVDPRVLIPRPETEELVEKVEAFQEGREVDRIIDLGTGSGVLALSLARIYQTSDVVAVDVSSEALEVARGNAKEQDLEERVTFLKSNWFGDVSGKFDLVVSNPPYLTRSEWEGASAHIKDWEPEIALVSGGDSGEDCLFSIIEGALDALRPGGILALETGISQRQLLNNKASLVGYSEFWTATDLSGRDRFFFARA